MRLHERVDRLTVTEYLRFGADTIIRFVQPLSSVAASARKEIEVKATDVISMFREYGKTPEKIRIFDDFTSEAIALTGVGEGLWIGFAGTDANATIGVVVASPEGTITMGSGDAAGSEDGSVLSRILLNMGALVSIGTQVFEIRVALDQLTGVTLWLGLADKICTNNEHPIHLVASGTVADGGMAVDDVAGFAFSSDADAPTKWQVTSEKNGTLGGAGGVAAAEEDLSEGPTANIYDTLRIEINKSGDIKFLINGRLVVERVAGVRTTAVLIPYLGIDAGSGAQTDTIMTIDSLLHEFERTATNA